jgi:UDP-N-acetylmuramyl pentapeptide phosphotransferase/UDP-N-acetylglucosamine-1-phosphate transferase
MPLANHDLILAKANLRGAQVKAAYAAGRSQNQKVRFWMFLANHDLILAKANLRGAQVKAAYAAGRSQNQRVRFWIITMLLVLFGLSTLKLR